MALTKLEKRNRVKRRVRSSINGTEQTPRLTVYRSNKEIYAQLVDDTTGRTLAWASSREKEFAQQKVTKVEQSTFVGKKVAERAVRAGLCSVVFDRNGFLYHGRVKALADAAREGGLKF